MVVTFLSANGYSDPSKNNGDCILVDNGSELVIYDCGCEMCIRDSRYAAKDSAGRERRAARELRAKITRHASALSQKLLRPSDQHHIPEAMRGSVAAMLESINQESQYTLDENGKRLKAGSGTPTKRTEAFRALKEQYAKIVAEGGDMVIDPSLLGSDADGIKGGFDAVSAMKDTKLRCV